MKLFILIAIVILELWTSSVQSTAVVKRNQSLFPLSIIHINDFHAKFEQTNTDSTSCKEKLGQICIGGIARVMTMVKQLKAAREQENKNPIFLNIGDNFVGSLWYELFGWNVTSHFWNIFPADATTLGNHEFDRGVQEVVHYLETLKSPVLVANLDDTDEPGLQGKYKKSLVIERDGRRIGLIGALVVATIEISNPEKLKILDEIESVKKEANRLKTDEGIDIIIVLSHCGLVIDRQMAQNSDGLLDVIVGGHSHSLLYKGDPVPGPDVRVDTYPIVYTQNNHKTLIVQASAYTKFIGDLTVYFDEDGEIQEYEGNTIFMDSSIVPDPEIIEEMKPWKESVDKIGQREIGSVKGMLYQKDCAFGECNIGDFVTDAFLDFIVNHPDFQDNHWSYATVAITNAGGIRTNLPPGVLVFDDLFTTLPFTNKLSVFELQGKDLLEVLQFSANAWRYYNFLQFSGMRVVYNVTRPDNERVVSVDVLCRECDIPRYEKLDLTKWYRLIVPSFIGNGGNGYVMFTRKRNDRVTKELDIEVVEEYFKKLSPVLQKKDGRITVLT
ncbi:apyrase-like [Chironomus tepperi]|uniref:apyrase-like n=1 Tax=Chironomus tepperi TaxID=113505 RepID=UPI00391EF2EE